MDPKHLGTQAWRFARIALLALAAQLLVLGHWPGWAALWSLAIGAAETALREMYPTISIYDAPPAAPMPASAPRSTTPGGGSGQ